MSGRSIGSWFKRALQILMVLGLGIAVVVILKKPSHDRDWSPDQRLLPSAEIAGDRIIIHNVRHVIYRSVIDYTPHWEDRSYDLSAINRAWFVVEPFSGVVGAAHTFLSFEFGGDQFVAISVEIRKERGEEFSPVKGLLRCYELMYVIADERDVIKLRSNYRQDQVFVYPVRATPGKVRELFLSMLERANAIARTPEFYNTLTNTCTTNIVAHVNRITPKRVPWWDVRIFLPANADRYAFELGLIDTDVPFAVARENFLINEKARQYADDPNFSVRIRENNRQRN